MIEPEIEKEPLYELSRAPRRRKENRLGARDRQLLFLLKSLFHTGSHQVSFWKWVYWYDIMGLLFLIIVGISPLARLKRKSLNDTGDRFQQ